MTPYIKTDENAGAVYTLPCGKCPECIKRRVSGWSFRLRQEEKRSQSAIFLTITYDTKHVPITKNGYMSLNKKHVQDYMKRLRKAHLIKIKNPKYNAKKYRTNKSGRQVLQHPKHIWVYPEGSLPIRYYIAGEYGTTRKRPHYHFIMFNARIELIQSAWNLGSCHYDPVNPASIGYCLKYISKIGTIPEHRNDDRLPEFALYSKGLGSGYLTPSSIRYHQNDPAGRCFLTIEDGKKIAIPRYYKDKMYDEDHKNQIAQHQKQLYADQLEKALNDPNYDLNRYNEEQAKIAAFRKTKTNNKKPDKF